MPEDIISQLLLLVLDKVEDVSDAFIARGGF